MNPAALTITANNAGKAYGQVITFSGTEFTATGLQNGQTVGLATLTSAGAAGTANVAGSPYAITASNATGGTFTPGNYAITYDPGLLTVNPAALTITASSLSKSYGQNNVLSGTDFTTSGLQNGETVGAVTLASAGAAGTASVAGSPYLITASSATGGSFAPGNYTITYDPGLLSVNPAALTIMANDISKTYGQTVTFTGTEFSAAGLQNGETVGSATLASAGAPATANVAGSPYAITVGNALGGTFNPNNYTITYDPGLLAVNPMTVNVTVTADSMSKAYGQAVTFTGTEFTSAGLQNGNTIGLVTLASAGAPRTADVGSYPIYASHATGGSFDPSDYIITYDPGVLTVNPAALTITANSMTKSYGQTVAFFGTEFTSSGLQNGQTIGSVALASAGAGPQASVAATPYPITASGASGGSFNPTNYTMTYAPGALTVDPAILSVGLVGTVTKVYDGTSAAALSGGNYTLAGVLNGDGVSLNDPAAGTFASRNVGTGIGITASGLQLSGAQSGDYVLAAGTVTGNIGVITPATLTYVSNPATMAMGAPIPALGGSVAGFVGADTPADATTGTLDFVTNATAGSAPGSYAIDGSGLSALNYVLAQAPANATALTVTHPINVGSQPVGVGTLAVPIATQGAAPQSTAANSPAGSSSHSSDTEWGAPGNSIQVGKFQVVYEDGAIDHPPKGTASGPDLSHASSFMIFRGDDTSGYVLKRPGS